MSLRRPFAPSRQREPALALINVVFLMLIFFLIAGTVAPALNGGIAPVRDVEAARGAFPDAAVVTSDGMLMREGVPITVETLLEADVLVRLIPDRALPATELLRLTRALQEAGATEIWIIAERSGSP